MRTDILPKNQLKSNVPDLRTGQVVRVHERIKEGDKERTQVFEGLVIAVKHGKGLDGTFTVRKIGAGGVGVERIFPIHMPAIEKIEVLRQEKVRQSKLYFVRGQVGQKVKKRKTKLQSFIFDMGGTVEEEVTPEEAEETQPEEEAPEKAKTEEVTAEENSEEAPEKEEEAVEEPQKEESAEEPKEESTETPAEEKSEEPKKEESTEGKEENKEEREESEKNKK